TATAIQRPERRAVMIVGDRDREAWCAPRSRRPFSGRRLQRQEDRVLAAADEEEDVLALLDLLERGLVGIGVFDRLTIHLEDDVAPPDAGFVGCGARLDGAHHDALGLL